MRAQGRATAIPTQQPTTVTIITWNEPSPKMTERVPGYTRILKSLKLSTPQFP